LTDISNAIDGAPAAGDSAVKFSGAVTPAVGQSGGSLATTAATGSAKIAGGRSASKKNSGVKTGRVVKASHRLQPITLFTVPKTTVGKQEILNTLSNLSVEGTNQQVGGPGVGVIVSETQVGGIALTTGGVVRALTETKSLVASMVICKATEAAVQSKEFAGAFKQTTPSGVDVVCRVAGRIAMKRSAEPDVEVRFSLYSSLNYFVFFQFVSKPIKNVE